MATTPEPCGDQDHVDTIFDAAFTAASDGEPFDPGPWLAGQQHLREAALAAIALAQATVVQHPPRWPTIAGHELLAELGRGAMGTVYRARRTRDGKEVAFKVLPPVLLLSTGARQRLRAEASALQKLAHEHIVPIGDFVDGDDVCGFSMDLVPGLSLAQLLTHLRALAAPDLADVARTLGSATLPDGNQTAFWLGDRWDNQRPGPPGTHRATIPGPDAAVNAPAEPRSGTAFRPVSRLHPRPLPARPTSRSSSTASAAPLPVELQLHLPRR